MRDDVRLVSDLSVLATGAVFVVGLVVLGFRLAQVQLVDVAKYLEDGSRQAARRVQTAGPRGRIIARDGTVLADNRASVTIVLSPEAFQRRNWPDTVLAISNAVEEVSAVIGLAPPLATDAIARHDGNLSAAGRELGLSPRMMNYRMNKLGIAKERVIADDCIDPELKN